MRGYAFGPFVVDPVKRRLWRESLLVPISSKTFDVLVMLLEHRNHIVSKDELLNRVWPNTSVNENNLTRQISSVRRALGQRPDQHDYVVTIPGQGYRFVATVQELAAIPAMDLDDSRAGAHPYDDAFTDSSSRSTKRSRSLALVAAGCGLLAAGMAVALLRRPAETDPGPRRTLQRITYDEAALPRDASWAPDSQWMVYASDRAGNADLWKQHLGNPDPRA